VVRGVLWAGLGLAALPIVVLLPLRWIDPPATAFQLARAVERAWNGDRPIWPVRIPVARARMAPAIRRAALAAEDDRFFLHHGFDLVEIDKALERAERGGRLRGASTISQQLAKNLLLWEGRSWVRKGYELWITLVLELVLPKERILDLYLNAAEWGDGLFGIEAAARRWYGTTAARLSREQAARLAAILPAPRRWTPGGSVASRRAPIILGRMRYAAPRPID
jgi:monofunctional biosynthetic peptidoglycan transglycosylase